MLNADAEQMTVYNAIREGRNIFLTGSGGNGKTFLANHVRVNNPEVTIIEEFSHMDEKALDSLKGRQLLSDCQDSFHLQNLGVEKHVLTTRY